MFLSAFDNWYGLLIASGILLGITGAYFAARHRGVEGDIVIDFIIFCLPLAIIGARVYHVVFDVMAGNEWTFAEFCGFDSDSGNFKGLAGLAIYGGLIGAIGGAVILHFWKNRKSLPENKRVSFWQIVDVGFTFIMLGQVVARWGNFTNGEAYGDIVTSSAFQWSPISMKVDGVWRQSIWFYESLWNFFGFFILLFLYLGRYKSFDGFVFAAYGIYYGIGRTWIEAIRVDDVLYLGGMRISVFVSVMFIIMGVVIIAVHIILAKKAGKKVFIFVERKKLNDDYYGYEKTKLAHPMPDIVFFKDRHKVKQKGSNIIVDESGLAIKVEDDSETLTDEPKKQDKPQEKEKPKVSVAEEEYEDKWDD